MRHKRAFTLIELLVVIAIVGILSGFIAISMNNATAAAKDAKRKAGIDMLRKALLMYKIQNGSYPTANCSSGSDCPALTSALVPSYLPAIPNDLSSGTYYSYSSTDGTDFTIGSNLSDSSNYTYTASAGFSSSPAIAGPAGYSRRIPITISNLSGETLSNYQVMVTLPYDSDMQSDFDDIRFTAGDGSTLLPYYLESKIDSSTSQFWVKISNIPTGSSTIYAYYNNPTASSASDGNATFLLFDDFPGSTLDTSKWFSNNLRGSYSVGSNRITFNGSSWWGVYIGSVTRFDKTKKYLLSYSAYDGGNGGSGCCMRSEVSACSYSNTVTRDTTYYYLPENGFHNSYSGYETCVILDAFSAQSVVVNKRERKVIDVSANPLVSASTFNIELHGSDYYSYPVYYSQVFLSNYISSPPTSSLGGEEAI